MSKQLRKVKINILEVAKLAGVSKSTVSRVVSDRGGSVSQKAVDKVNAVIKEMGYTRNMAAASLRTSKTYLALLMVPDVANPFWSEIARSVQDALEKKGYSVVVGNTDWKEDREEKYVEFARSGRFDGLIINSVTDKIASFKATGIPVVLIGERSETTEIDTVGTDTYAATIMGLEYLYGQGHRKIGIATSERGSERFLSRRYMAYKTFLAEKGMELDQELVFTVQLSESGGKDLASRILNLPDRKKRMSAILCGNDILAISALNALRSEGMEPGRDISIIGMDDIPASAQTWPALTTIRKPRTRIGEAAAELLIKRIEEPGRQPEKHLFPGTLVVRDSVAKKGTDR